jgi:hypothetical protein
MVATGSPADAAPAPTTQAASSSQQVFWFASPTDSQVVATTGGRRATLDAFPTAQVLAGQFVGNSAFLYNPGPGPDGLVRLADDGETLTASLAMASVGGTYRPIVLDVDLDGTDEILWYSPGPGGDFLWRFGSTGAVTSHALTINGRYEPIPLVLDGNGGSVPDRQAILWYGRGTAADAFWVFDAEGTPKNVAGGAEVNGDYVPVVAHLNSTDTGGHDQIFWYDVRGRRHTVWTFRKGSGGIHTSTAGPVLGPGCRPSSVPIRGFGFDVLHCYRPGPGTEQLMDQMSSGSWTVWEAGAVNGTYRTLEAPGHRSPMDFRGYLGPGPVARLQQMNPESAPALYGFVKLSDLPDDPVGAFAPYVTPA